MGVSGPLLRISSSAPPQITKINLLLIISVTLQISTQHFFLLLMPRKWLNFLQLNFSWPFEGRSSSRPIHFKTSSSFILLSGLLHSHTHTFFDSINFTTHNTNLRGFLGEWKSRKLKCLTVDTSGRDVLARQMCFILRLIVWLNERVLNISPRSTVSVVILNLPGGILLSADSTIYNAIRGRNLTWIFETSVTLEKFMYEIRTWATVLLE